MDDVRDVMATNHFGAWAVTKALLIGLKAAAPADVVNVVSAVGSIANPSSGPYVASKHAQLAMSRCLTADLRRHGIRVHAILPGKADTEGHPYTPSGSLMSRLTTTDVETVSRTVVRRVGRRRKEVYVPRLLKAVAVLNDVMPVTTGRAVKKLIK